MFVQILRKIFHLQVLKSMLSVTQYQYKITHKKEYKELVYILWYSMFHLWNDGKQDELKSVVGDEYIFKDKPEKLAALKVLEDEVYKINKDLGNI